MDLFCPPFASCCACGLGRYPSLIAALRTDSRRAAVILPLPVNAAETVERVTPSSRSTSCSVNGFLLFDTCDGIFCGALHKHYATFLKNLNIFFGVIFQRNKFMLLSCVTMLHRWCTMQITGT